MIIRAKIPFLSFSFLFLMKYKFPQQNINQSERGIGEKKLSVELYACFYVLQAYSEPCETFQTG